MKLLSPSPEAVAVILGLSQSEAATLLHQRRLFELGVREDERRRRAKGSLGMKNRLRTRCS